MSVSENTNSLNREEVRPGIRFSNSVKVRTFQPVMTNWGINTGETNIVSEQNVSHENIEDAYKSSRNTLKAGQNASKQQRIRSRDKKRTEYKQQIAKNLQVIRRRVEEFQRTPPDAATLSQFKGAIDQDFHRIESVLQSENRLRLGIFNEEIAALHQLASEIHQLQPASDSTSTSFVPEVTAEAEEMQRRINYVEQLLNDMERLFLQKPTMQILADLDTMITQADQIIRALLGVPKTPEERGKITELIGRLKGAKGRYNHYVLSSVGKKGGRRTVRRRSRSHRKTTRSR